jgi:simple sugar transport system ATP-binding protein
VSIESPAHARSLGVAMVFQHFALFDALTVLENVTLGVVAQPRDAIRGRLRQLADRYGLAVAEDARVHDLSVGERQRVEILRALMADPRLLILDEPTSVLTPQAVDALFATLERLASDGVGIVFVSHKLDEIRRIAHRCVVMRDGRVVAELDPREETEGSLARLMVGAEPPNIAEHESPPGGVVLEVRGLDHKVGDRQHWLHAIDLDLHRGEIVGLAGVSGNGQTALLAILAGEWRAAAGSIRLLGEEINRSGPRQRRNRGLRSIPADRLGHGAVAEMTLAENVVLTGSSFQRGGWIHSNPALEAAAQLIGRFRVRASGPSALAGSLSGGNLQKFIVGREIVGAPIVLLVDQPTWGVDVGSAAAIRNELIGLRAAGCAALVVSEELDELYELSDRLIVMFKGRLSPSVRPRDIGTGELGRWMAGLWPADVEPAAA